MVVTGLEIMREKKRMRLCPILDVRLQCIRNERNYPFYKYFIMNRTGQVEIHTKKGLSACPSNLMDDGEGEGDSSVYVYSKWSFSFKLEFCCCLAL